MESIDIKGVRIRPDGLAPETATYLEGKLQRIRRLERRERNPLARLWTALLPAAVRREVVESWVRGRVLVVGCGGGIETLGLGGIGIDVDRALLRAAADLRAHAEGTAAAFAAASAGDLPFPAASFDGVLSDNVAEHLPGAVLRRHLRESARVLRPGGRYVLATPNALFERPAREGHVSLHSYAEWEGLLREAGFRELLTPRLRSGPLEDLSRKKAREGRPWRLGASRLGVRLVTIIASI